MPFRHAQDSIADNPLQNLQDLKYALDESAIVAITNVQGDILYANDKFCEISGYGMEELLGRNHRILKSGHHSDEFFRDMWRTISQGEVWHGEIKNRAKDGSFYWVDTTIVPLLNERNKPSQYIAIRYEITDRKRMEEEIRLLNEELEKRVYQRTAELEKTNAELKEVIHRLQESERLRETFTSALTHDLRTPLVAQQRAYEILLGQKSALPPKLTGLVERLVSSNDDLLEMVNKLLEINQYEAGKVSLLPEDVNLADIAGECIAEVSLIAENREIGIINDIPADMPEISGDRNQLKRVFVNLIGNALDNIPVHSHIRLSGSVKDDEIELQVSDNGPGIAPEILPHLFDRYFVVQRTRKKIGSGLGLYICKMILNLHNGKIRVDSTVGQGTTFTLTLPLNQKKAGEPK